MQLDKALIMADEALQGYNKISYMDLRANVASYLMEVDKVRIDEALKMERVIHQLVKKLENCLVK